MRRRLPRQPPGRLRNIHAGISSCRLRRRERREVAGPLRRDVVARDAPGSVVFIHADEAIKRFGVVPAMATRPLTRYRAVGSNPLKNARKYWLPTSREASPRTLTMYRTDDVEPIRTKTRAFSP
jgi:hypothetical protein